MPAPDERVICIVIHDVAPATWRACQWLLDRVKSRGDFAVTLLAVPHYHRQPRSAGFERWLLARERAGDEVALHGFDHLDAGEPRGLVDRLRRRFYTRGEGEFAALDLEQATRRLLAGRAWLGELGIRPAGFVAPAWLLGDDAWRAVQAQAFRYTCTLRHIYLLGADRPEAPAPANASAPAPAPAPASVPAPALVCQSQVYSSANAWRQTASVLWNESLALCQRTSPVVRLELHPGDIVPAVSRSWQRLLGRQIATRRVRTLAQLAEHLRTARAPSTP